MKPSNHTALDLFPGACLDKISRFLRNNNETLAVAESVTSGWLQAAFSSADKAIEFYQGGITAYNVAQKYRHLDVEPIHALARNAVSEKVATEMALHVCWLFTSDWGIGVTGYASPVAESGQELFAYYAVASRGEIRKAERLSALPGGSLKVQLLYCNSILESLAGLMG